MDEATIERVLGLQRPHRNLLKYYVLVALLFGPLFPLVLPPLLLRFRSLRYAFDGEGVSMRWGVLFRREISLNYSRLQDIHLTSNVVERWLGLAKVRLQTASGAAAAEMTIEGLREFEMVRDFLYTRMRGADEGAAGASREAVAAEPLEELLRGLTEVARELSAIRRLIDERLRPGSGRPGPSP